MSEIVRNIKKVYKYGKKYRNNLIQIIIASILSTIIWIILPLITAKQIMTFTSSFWQQLIYVSLIIFIIQAFNSFIAMFLLRRNNQKFIKGTMKNLQVKLGQEILKIKQGDIDKSSSGMFTQRMINDTLKMSSYIGWRSLKEIRIIFANIGSLFATFLINKKIFLFYLVASIILSILYIAKSKKVGKLDEKFRDETEKVSGLTGELIRGIKDIKMLNAEESFIHKLEENIDNQNEKRFCMAKANMKYNYIIEMVRNILEFILIIFLVNITKNNEITVALAIALFNYKSGIMNTVIESLGNFLELSKDFNISCERVFDIIENKEFSKEKFGQQKIVNLEGNFEFKNVTFGYIENKDILKDMSFKINSGEMVGIVGKSGAGKTTIFNLLCKIYDIKSGKIYIDEKEINEIDKESIRGNITIIPQNPYIFNLSIKDNLKLVKQDLTDEQIKEACKVACLEEFIENLPDKYDTIVGEAGVILSGGQKQRLAIARALVQNTKIILFDEATSALDNQTQTQIKEAINNLKEKYTILIIAHRLSTVIDCDRILLIDDGKVKAEGKHEELIEKSEEYRKLCEKEII